MFGTVELRLCDLASVQGIPLGVRVRVLLGRTRTVPLHLMDALAARTFGAAGVEVAGTHPDAVGTVVAYLRRRHAEWQRTEDELQREQRRREAAFWGDVA